MPWPLINASGNTYATTLWIKVALVLVAMAIGAYNRFRGFPATVNRDQMGLAILSLLRVEPVILVGALCVALALGTMPPPASN
jgi:putative copper export protein